MTKKDYLWIAAALAHDPEHWSDDRISTRQEVNHDPR